MKLIMSLLMLAAAVFADCTPWVAGAKDYRTGDCVTLSGTNYVAQRDVNAWIHPTDSWFWAVSGVSSSVTVSSSTVTSSSSAIVLPAGKQTINLRLNQSSESVYFVAPYDALVTVSYNYFVNASGVPEATVIPPFHGTIYVSDMHYGRPESIVEAYLPVAEMKGNTLSMPTVGPLIQGGIIPAGHRFGIWLSAPNLFNDPNYYIFNASINLTIEPASPLVPMSSSSTGN